MTKQPYPSVDANPNFAQLEEQILQYWESDKTFAKSVEQRDRKNAYVFYDGPPFANGLPHYGHLLTGYVKDAIARYQTMNGFRVERRFGWDCHGLPAEMGAEKDLGISGRAAIMEYGIDKFNDYCRSSVMKYRDEWRYYVTRQGRWVDFDNDYKTMDKDFMESCLWAFKQLYDKGLVYESMRVMPYSWAAETPLSNFETRLDNATREREDKAAFVKFKLKSRPEGAPEAKDYYLIAWTTTPWTLPSNLALSVSTEMQYVAIEGDNEFQIIAEPSQAAFEKLTGNQGNSYTIKGQDLIGLSYEPLFPYFKDTSNAFRVIDGSEAVIAGEGTGVIHMAPGFGEIDQKICADNGIEVIVPVDGQGKFMDAIYDLPDLKLKGLNVIDEQRLEESDKAQHIAEKDVAKFGLANMRILRWLKAHDRLVKDEVIKHNYPHCWRTDKPLIYRAMPSWYVAVTQYRDRAAEVNKTIDWIPGHIRDGQMDHMLKTAPDWSISRNRFWGTPIPVWRSPSGKIKVFGSIAELEAASGQTVSDLHRPMIDEITITEDGETYTRVEDVFDCWFESGSMPYAQLHYPFENKDHFEENFPAQFITEYVGQTRGWFNTLIMLSTAIFDKAPFEHCICHGVVIDAESGLKYSKRLKNYKDPKEVMDQFGADALRWLMLASPVMRGSDLSVDPDGKFIRDMVRLNLKPIWNAYNFFTLYANADGLQAKDIVTSDDTLDRYILAKCKAATIQIKTSLDAYDTPGACEAVTAFFDVLNNWYIRRSKERFWSETKSADKQAAYDTLLSVLNIMCKAAAPLLPFLTEAIYRGLNGESTSVHLQDFPDVSAIADAPELVCDMDRVRDACTTMLAIRNNENIRVRQPLGLATLYGAGAERLRAFEDIMKDELNLKRIHFADSLKGIAEYNLTINFPVAGKRLGPKMKSIAAAAKSGDWKNEGGRITVADETMEEGEYNLLLKSLVTKGAQSLSTNDAMVVLDLAITPELEAEGIARDVVRMIQQARKDAGLHVSDRIALTLTMTDAIAKAVDSHKSYIAEQTLANEVSRGEAAKASHHFTNDLDGEQIVIGLSKAA